MTSAPPTSARSPRHALTLSGILVCFLGSGFCSIVYEVIWVRLFSLSLGTTTLAVSAVLAAYFLGMAAGSLWSGRRVAGVERPLRTYAALEAAIGLSALFLTALMPRVHLALDPVLDAANADSAGAHAAAGTLAAFVLMGVPTFCMGATMPFLARYLIRTEGQIGTGSGWLYFVNTAGAVVGAWGAGFELIPHLGVAWSVRLTAGFNLAVAGAALVLSGVSGEGRRTPTGESVAVEPPSSAPPPPPEPAPVAARAAAPAALVLGVFALNGLVALLDEIAWTRILVIVVGGTIYGFSTMLATFLAGLALGGAVGGLLAARSARPVLLFGWLELALALATLLTSLLLDHVPIWSLRLASHFQQGLDPLLLRAGLSAAALLLPTVLFGMCFPVVVRLVAPVPERAPHGIGVAYCANTLGGIAGSLLTAHLLVPVLGVASALLAGAGVNLACAAVLLGRSAASPGARETWRARTFRLGLVAATALFAVSGIFRVHPIDHMAAVYINPYRLTPERLDQLDLVLRQQNGETIFYREGKTSTVSVHRLSSLLILRNNGLNEAQIQEGTEQPSSGAEALLGALPYLFATRLERALVIGLGGGVTVATLCQTPVQRVDVVEIEEGVQEAIPYLYPGRKDPTRADPRVHVILADGRNHLQRNLSRAAERFDIIASQPSHPWLSGVANLFTRDQFRLVRANLREGGVFCQWFNCFTMEPESLRSVLAAFREVFPVACVFRFSQSLLLVGTVAGSFDSARLTERLADAGVVQALAAAGIRKPADVLACLVLDAAAMERMSAGMTPNSDDNAYVETRLPAVAYRWEDLTARVNRLIDEQEVHPLAALARAPGGVSEAEVLEALIDGRNLARAKALLSRPFPGRDPVTQDFLRARIAWGEREADRALELLRAGIAARPDYTPARRTLARCLNEQGRYEEAVKVLEADPALEIPLGWAATRAGFWDHPVFPRLIERFRRHVAERTPADPELAKVLGAFHTRPGASEAESKDALALLDACIVLEPASEQAHYLAGLAAWQLGRFADAQRYWNWAASLAASRAEILHTKGLLALNAGDYPVAIDLLERAVNAFPPDWTYHRNLFAVYRLNRQIDEAIGALNRYIDACPDKGLARGQTRALLVEAGLSDRARQLK